MAFDLGSIFASVSLNTSQLDKGLMATQLKIAQADTSISSFGQKMSLNSTKFLVAGGLMAGSVLAVAAASIKMASQFETSMRNVNSISKLSEEAFAAQSKEVVNLSKTLPQSAKVLADGLYDIASSGFQGAAGMKILEASAKAASAGLTTTAVSAKGITAVINAYGLEAEDAAGISDTMFKTVDRGVISFEELSSTVGDWIGLAKIAGISFNEASGAIAYMTTKGIGASEAGTALQRLMLSFITPTDEMAAAIKNAGYETGEAMLKQIGLTGSMDFLSKATGGSVTELNKLIPRIEGVKGANALLGSGYEDLTKFMEDFKDTTGATAIALKEQSKSLSFQLDILKNNATAMGIELGNKLIPPIAALVKKLNELSPETKDSIYNFAEMTLKVIAAGGGVLLLTGMFAKLNMIIKANPIGAVIAAFVAFNGAVDLGSSKLEAMNNKWADFGSLVLQSLAPLVAVKQSVTTATTIISAYRDGTIKLSEAHYINIFAMDDEIKRIKLLQAEHEADKTATVNLANSTFNYTDALAASTTTMDANKVTMESMGKTTDAVKQSTDELIASLYSLYNINQSVTEATWSYDDAIKNLDEVMKNANSTEREKQTAIFATQDALENLQIAMAKEYEDTNTSIERKKELQNQYIQTGIEAVKTGTMSSSAFASMAQSFGMSVADIIAKAEAMGIELDAVTRARIIMISVDTSQSVQAVRDLQSLLNGVHDKTVTIETIYKQSRMLSGGMAMGGIVGYANGGTVGMPQAASGMVVPQTGRAIPILAHEGELILNNSEMKNVADAIWGVANGKGGGGGMTVNLTVVSQNPLTPADIARETKNALRLYGLEASLN